MDMCLNFDYDYCWWWWCLVSDERDAGPGALVGDLLPALPPAHLHTGSQDFNFFNNNNTNCTLVQLCFPQLISLYYWFSCVWHSTVSATAYIISLYNVPRLRLAPLLSLYSVYVHSREKQLRFIVLEEIYSKYSQERYVKIDFVFVLHFNILQKHMHSQLLFNKNTFYM